MQRSGGDTGCSAPGSGAAASSIPTAADGRVNVVAARPDSAATNGTGRTAYGEVALGQGKIRFLGALLPDPTEEFDHRYGLQNYAVTYTGYTLLENMLK